MIEVARVKVLDSIPPIDRRPYRLSPYWNTHRPSDWDRLHPQGLLGIILRNFADGKYLNHDLVEKIDGHYPDGKPYYRYDDYYSFVEIPDNKDLIYKLQGFHLVNSIEVEAITTLAAELGYHILYDQDEVFRPSTGQRMKRSLENDNSEKSWGAFKE